MGLQKKWNPKIKGPVDRYKARLVSKGYKRIYYDEVFAPVIRIETIFFQISIDVQKNWSI